jgi:ATP-dependent helicase HrpB
MVLRGRDLGAGGLACAIAALLSERDILRGARDADLRRRLDLLRGVERGPVDRGGLQRVRDAARQLRRQTGVAEPDGNSEAAGLLLALAYPDRIAQRRGGSGLQYRLSNGRGAFFAEPDPLATSELLAVADLDGDKREARIFLAAPLLAAELESAFAEQITDGETVSWDSREQLVSARRQRKLGELLLKDEALRKPSPAALTAAMLAGIRDMGLACLPWTDFCQTLRARIAFLRRVEGDSWPDLSDAALLAALDDWLAPWLDGLSRRAHLDRLDMAALLSARLPWEKKQALDGEAPTHLTVPSGSRIPIDYTGENPVLAVRLQELFGLAETPRVAGGRVRLTLHLLSPARRPVQVTQDLASFWANTYKQVKADLKGQYPKHSWPDDPLQAAPTARAKPRGT